MMRAPFTWEALPRQVISRGGNKRKHLQRMICSCAGSDRRNVRVRASCLEVARAEKLTGVALNHNGGIYAVGVTNSADFPAIHPLQKSLRGTSDAFLTKLALPAMKMTFLTTFGGSAEDSGWALLLIGEGTQ